MLAQEDPGGPRIHAPPPSPAPSRRARWPALLAVLALGVVLPALLFEFKRYLPIARCPCALLFGIWGLALVVRGTRARGRSGRGALAFNLGVLFVGLAVVEVLLIRPPHPDIRYVQAPAHGAHRTRTQALGYVPVPDRRWRFAAEAEGEPVFDVHYTTDPRGRRLGPARDGAPDGSILCFGCSFTFGHGVEDHETYPWQLQELLGHRLRVENFAFIGYGPHQMLAQIQEGVVEAAVVAPPAHAVYLAIVDHPRRVTARQAISRFTPRFVLREDDTVVRDGLWADVTPSAWMPRVMQLLRHANLVARAEERIVEGGTAGDLRLYVAIVQQARAELRTRWPDCDFLVVVWDEEERLSGRLIRALEAAGIAPTRMSAIAPDFRTASDRYRLHSVDRHPSPYAHEVLATYLARRLPPPAAARPDAARAPDAR